MEFWKLERLMATSKIWMTRANLSGDPLDGSYTDANVDHYNRTLMELYGDYGKWLAGRLATWNRALTGWIYINCWLMKEHESDGMWNAYAGADPEHRVAVKTNVGNLRQAVTDGHEVYLGVVRYIDFGTQIFDRGNALPPYFNKAQHFDSENEVRLLHVGNYPGKYIVDDLPAGDGPAGVEIAVDLKKLITAVVPGPHSGAKLEQDVHELLGVYGIGDRIERSELERRARF